MGITVEKSCKTLPCRLFLVLAMGDSAHHASLPEKNILRVMIAFSFFFFFSKYRSEALFCLLVTLVSSR